jgi:1-deoxy-D-xylulose-5-phosphate synthase
LGLPDRFIDHGDPAKLLAACGLDGAGIARSIRERFLSSGAMAGQSSVKRVA